MTTTTSGRLQPDAVVPAGTNPFPGLRPFREDEAHLFFGRESQVDAMVNKLAATRFLAVVGGSGSGKSSLVNCGLRPALHGGLMASAGTAWRMAQFRPGSDPLPAMADALAKDGVLFPKDQAGGLTLTEIVDTTLRMSTLGLIDIYEQARLGDDVNLLVVVDQFEELFRYRQLRPGREENAYGVGEAAVAFVNLLLEAKEQRTQPIYVVLTMRSDFLGDCSEIPGLPEAINGGQYLVPRMTRDERRAAISGPVGVSGATMAPVLLTRLVNDVGDNPDQLSILQHALNRTWACWQREEGGKGSLDLSHYEAIGTMAHALDEHAERAYAELDPGREQQICEKIFKALTDKATDLRGVRRPTTLGTVCELADATAAEVTEVIDVFRRPSRSFLMPPAGEGPLEPTTVIDISHESLMRVWRRLNRWADEEAQSAQTYRRLADTAALHAEGSAGLWRDPDLQLALNWRDQSRPNEIWASRYHPGFAAAMSFLQQSAEEAERSRRVARRNLISLGGVLVLVAIFAVLVVLALIQRSHAQHSARVASSLLAASTANDLAGSRLDESLLIALAIDGKDATAQARSAMTLALEQARRSGLDAILHSSSAQNILCVAFSPDGGILATGSDDGTVRLWDIETRKQVGALPAGSRGAAVKSVAFSPDGQTLATGTDEGRAQLWDVAKSAPLGAPLIGGSGGTAVNSVAFSRAGRMLATGSIDGTVQLWDVATRKPLGDPLTGSSGAAVNSVALSPDGYTLASGNEDGTVRLWKVATRKGRLLPTKSGYAVNSVAFDGDGQTLATGDDNGTARLWKVATGTQLGAFSTGVAVSSVAFGRDGHTLATGNASGSVQLWDVATGKRLGSPLVDISAAAVNSVAFSSDGHTLATGNTNGTAQLWNLAIRRQLGDPLTRSSGAASVTSVAFSPDGHTLATGSIDGTVELWDVVHRVPQPLPGSAANVVNRINSVAFNPDGRTLATGGRGVPGENGTTVQLWDVTRRLLDTPPLVSDSAEIRSVAFSPDGHTLATGSIDGTVQLWDVATRKPLSDPLTGSSGAAVNSVAFSSGGHTLATGSIDGTVQLWDVATGTPLGDPLTGSSGAAVNSVAFSPDGLTLATSDSSAVRLWEGILWSDFANLESQVCSFVWGNLSADEWRTLAPGLGNHSGC